MILLNKLKTFRELNLTFRLLMFLVLPILFYVLSCEKPERYVKLEALEIPDADISYTYAVLRGEIIDLGSTPITDHGIVISESGSPVLGISQGLHLGQALNKGIFQDTIKNLKKNTLYYFRIFVIVDGQEKYSRETPKFRTKDTKEPTVTAGTITDITMTSASLPGEVTSDGGEPETVKGLCWGASPNPTIASCIDTTVNGTGKGSFAGAITALNPGTIYYVRAYATNLKGTAYSDADVVFKTHNLPGVTTTAVSAITDTGATSGGNVTDDGDFEVIERGSCWGTASSPTIELTTKTSDGSGKGTFVSTITGLTPLTTYFVRAYATNKYGTSYGEELSFTATKPSAAVTKAATLIGNTTVTLNGTVNANTFTTTVTFEYGLTTDYGTSVSATPGTVYGTTATDVLANVTLLNPGTIYHYRVKAVSEGGTSYGEDLTFTTLQPPSATTGEASNITTTSATLNGTVNANNSSTTVSFEFGTTTDYGSSIAATPSPITGNTSTTVTATLTGLTEGTIYHYRVKAISDGGTVYSDDVIITSLALPVLTTTVATSITFSGAATGGNITSDGGASIIAKGVCWSINPNPTISDSKTADGTGTGVFTSIISGLSPNTTYYVRAYATNSAGIAYGSQVIFTSSAAGLSSGLVAYYPFNGNANDESGNGNNGTVYEATLALDRFGNLNSAYNFDGSNDYIAVPPSSSTNTANMDKISISIWANPNLYNINDYNRMFNISNQTDNINLDCNFQTDGTAVFLNYTGFNNDHATATTTNIFPLNTWQHFVAIMDFPNKTAYLYANGNLVGTDIGTIATRPTNPYIVLGKILMVTSAPTISGRLDDVRVYNRALTPVEIQQLFNEGGYTPPEVITDIDGNSYNTVKIGNQTWMKENLKSTKYTDGSNMSVAWAYGDNESLVNIYGRLYRWYEATDVRNACPSNWHVPNYSEWIALESYLGGSSVAGGKMKESGLGHWNSPNTGATNESGFTALPGGDRYPGTGVYGVLGIHSYLWSRDFYVSVLKNDEPTLSVVDAMYADYGFSIRCIKGELPLTETVAATAVASTAATLNGKVNPNGASTNVVFEFGETNSYGSLISISQSPVSGSVPVNVSVILSGLTPGTLYHFRVKAVNSGGTSYGSDMTFTTPAQVTDYESNVYNTVIIGAQIWMQENLKSTKYSDGTSISGFWAYDNNIGNVPIYGYLYNWYAVMNGASGSDLNPSGVQGVCPTGWHVPSANEWDELSVFLVTDQGGKLKEAGFSHWTDPNSGATNESGFSALPGGSLMNSPYYGFMSFGSWAGFWTSTFVNEMVESTSKALYYNNAGLGGGNGARANGLSLRCIKD